MTELPNRRFLSGGTISETQSLDAKSVLSNELQIMAVLNVTPDSFSDGGRLISDDNSEKLFKDKILYTVEQMLKDGADIIDIGGESTRPGASQVSVEQELQRVLPVVELINQHFDTKISVDTSSPQLMLESANLGISLINDVRALQREGALAAAAETGLPVCLMHMQGQPDNMQKNPSYTDVVSNVLDFLKSRIKVCGLAGISSEQIIIDPGFGFGKSDAHNLQLLNHLATFKVLNCPILVGLSRKSLIGRILNCELDERLIGSITLALLSIINGASIVRVHDVKETADMVNVYKAVLKNNHEL